MGDKKQIGWLTGLKGWCCITVVALHLLACFYAEVLCARTYLFEGAVYNFISLTPINIIFNGSFSVYIFWTISAFLIANSWFEKKSITDLKVKLLNKYFRPLFPIVVLSIVVFVVIKLGGFYNVEAGEIIGNSFFTNERDFAAVTFKLLLEDLLWNDFFTAKVMLIPPLWTMKTEIVGVCLTVLLLILFGNNKFRYVFLGIISIFTIRVSLLYVCFLAGIALADYYTSERKKYPFWGAIAIVAGVFFGAYPPSGIPESGVYDIVYRYMVIGFNEFFGVNTGVHALYIMSATLIIFGCISCKGIQRVLDVKFWKFFGDRSFYIYILHVPLIMSAVAYFFVVLYEHVNDYKIAVAASCAFAVILCAIVADLFKRFTEKWLNPVSKEIVKRIMKNERADMKG